VRQLWPLCMMVLLGWATFNLTNAGPKGSPMWHSLFPMQDKPML
jgi:hypothetical protein